MEKLVQIFTAVTAKEQGEENDPPRQIKILGIDLESGGASRV